MGGAANERVFVVSLGADTPAWSKISWRDIVNVKRRYFHPVGRRWPREPVSSIAFRYDGRLQSLHRVESALRIECRSHFERYFPEIDGEACRLAYDDGRQVPHFIYALSEPTVPDHKIPNGDAVVASRHVWADWDLLLSSQTISQAEELTKQRPSGYPATENSVTSRSGNTCATTRRAASVILPPIPDAESLIGRVRQLQGLPERNHEDAVKDLLVRLGHNPLSIVFQRGRIDVSLVNRQQEQHAVFEVKRSLADKNKRNEALRQANDYAGRTGAEIMVISDGDRYVIYDRRKGRSYDEMLCGEFSLTKFVPEDSTVLDLLRPMKA